LADISPCLAFGVSGSFHTCGNLGVYAVIVPEAASLANQIWGLGSGAGGESARQGKPFLAITHNIMIIMPTELFYRAALTRFFPIPWGGEPFLSKDNIVNS
jgi:hypothetical protein